jgi:CHAT domain-containing protein/tetratricopeptide (TPR) repeat protein
MYTRFFVFGFSFWLCTVANAQNGRWEKLNAQGENYYAENEYEKALDIFVRALPIAVKEFGKTHVSYATACDNLGFMHTVLGNYVAAEPFLLESKSLREKLVKDTPEYGTTCVNLADLYNAMGLYPKAEALYIEGVEVFKKVSGDSSLEYALAINNLAGLYFTLGDYKKTEANYSKAREIWATLLGKESEDYATSCNNLGALYQQMGEFRKAETLYIEANEIQKRIFGKDGVEYATSCNNLGDLYREEGNYSKAEPLYLQAMEIRARVFGEAHHEYAQSCGNVGLLYDELGQYGKAEQLLIKARNAFAKATGKDHPDYAGSCNQLAILYRALGNNAKAEALYLEALDIFGRVVGKNHSDYAQVCNDLAGFYRSIKEYDKSEALYIESKKIRADIYGKETPTYAASCSNLGLLYYTKSDYAKAEPLYQEAFEIIKEKMGKHNAGYGRNRNNLAMLYSKQGNSAAAEPLFEEARQNWERTLGKKNPEYALVCNNFGHFYSENGQFEKAEPLFNEAMEIQLAQIEQNFKSLSQKEQQQYYQSINFYFNNYTSFAFKYYPNNNAIAGNLYNLRLATKGLIFNSALKTRLKILASGDTSLLRKYESVKTIRNYLAKVYRMSADDKAKKNIDERVLEEQANGLEKELTEQSSTHEIAGVKEGARVTWQQVSNKLKKNEAAVEIIRMQEKKDTIYIALILKSGKDRKPEMVEIKSGDEIEGRNFRYYRNCIQNLVEDKNSYNAFWKPIATGLHGIKKIYFSADGVYHQINLSTLKNPASSRYLGDELVIQLVGSTRELTYSKRISNAITAELFGYPDYKGDGTSVASDSSDRSVAPAFIDDLAKGFARNFDLQSGIPALPGTAKEVNTIDQLLEKNHIPKKIFTESLATEKQLKLTKDPRILHVATHGFFVPSLNRSTESHQFPLFRSGLLLADCEKSIQGFSTPEGEEDGILTAYEAMNLFLDDTDLVVLSACETGLGEIQNGEGVFGLQRAFQEAGARSILISLWKVDDAATQLLMTTFYNKYLKSGQKRESFIEAQKFLRSKYPQPYYWGAFVMMGE